jgi:hypothetical protein
MTAASELTASSPEAASFVRRAIGMRFEMRFKQERQRWPVSAWDVAETLAGLWHALLPGDDARGQGTAYGAGYLQNASLATFRILR